MENLKSFDLQNCEIFLWTINGLIRSLTIGYDLFTNFSLPPPSLLVFQNYGISLQLTSVLLLEIEQPETFRFFLNGS
jgi:hypothetical protein